MAEKFLGVVVSPEYVVCEGMAQVFENLEGLQADAIAVWPWLIEPVSQKEGARMPDLHLDGYRRVLGRPLWGKSELFVRSYPAYAPNRVLFAGSRYQPAERAPDRLDPELPLRMLAEARQRGMQAHLGIAPLLPPDLLPEDRPVRVDGEAVAPPYVAPVACLNNPAARAYAIAAIRDLLANYPGADGLILDWAEFGAYKLEDHFSCFCGHCERAAADAGFDWLLIKADVSAAWDRLHRLTPELLQEFRVRHEPRVAWDPVLAEHPGWQEFVHFKAVSVERFFRRVRKTMDQSGFPEAALTARGWCSPWNRSSGFDFQKLSAVCDAVSPKLFTFDHAALPKWAASRLQQWNPDLPERELLGCLLAAMNLPDSNKDRKLADYGIPGPEDEHPTSLGAYKERLQEMTAAVGEQAACYPISHPYLPAQQWRDMVALIQDSPVDGMWVNMYGYLSDEKLKILAETWSGQGAD